MQRLTWIVEDSTQGSQGLKRIGPNREHKDLKIGFLRSWLHCWLVRPPPMRKDLTMGPRMALNSGPSCLSLQNGDSNHAWLLCDLDPVAEPLWAPVLNIKGVI